MVSADTARLIAQLILDDRQFQASIARSVKGTQKLDSTLSKVGSKASKGLSTAANNVAKISAIGSGLVVTGLALAVNEASNLNEEINKSTVVFGKAAKSVIDFSKTTDTSLGLSQSAALAAAGAFGNMFNTVGLTQEQSADFSKTLVTLAADMASFNNEDPTEMLDRLRSGLSGEAEPLRRFGVLLSEAAVQAEAYATGIAKTGDELTETQKVQARYSLILKQTKVQQGDAGRTINEFAGQQRVLRASLANTAATIGTALLPKVTEMAIKINKLIKDNGPAIQKFADQLPAAFDKALAFAEKLPWEQIGKGLETAAFFAGKLVDVFIAMPPEAQTALIALAGLNKLSGGAITGIVGELGKGLIKGVLGINAAHVTVNAATVSGAGGIAAGNTGNPGRFNAVGGFVLPALAVAGIQQASKEGIIEGIRATTGNENLAQTAGKLQNVNVAAFGPPILSFLDNLEPALQDVKRIIGQGDTKIQSSLAQNKQVTQQAAFAIRDKVGTSGGLITAAVNAVKAVAAQTTAAARAAGQQAAFAIRDKDLSVSVANSVHVNTSVSVRETSKTQTTYKQFSRFIS